ncbi:nucleotidyl transferase AbiEii/AbiGii toxin family protein [Marinobacter sp.]
MERFLYRLSQSPHNRCFTLKGALMLWAMQGPNSRPTRDIDP